MIFFSVCPRVLYGTSLHKYTHVYETVPGLHGMAGPRLPLRTSGMTMGFCPHTGLCFANLAPFPSTRSMASPDSHSRFSAWPPLQHLCLRTLTWCGQGLYLQTSVAVPQQVFKCTWICFLGQQTPLCGPSYSGIMHVPKLQGVCPHQESFLPGASAVGAEHTDKSLQAS